MACELRRLGAPERAGFMKWDAVLASAGRLDEAARPMRYNWGASKSASGGDGGGSGPHWFVLSQMYYNENEVSKLLAASDVAIVNYGLHYCQPARPGADAGCLAKFQRYESEMHKLFGQLQAWTAHGTAASATPPGGGGRRVAIFQETSSQHFPLLPELSASQATGDWELRDFFPHLGPMPPKRCQCMPTRRAAVPLRTQLLRNLSRSYPGVRVLRLHDLLSPRYGWHQQDCKGRAKARAELQTTAVVHGCDCTHYCHSPSFWRRYWYELRRLLAM